MRSGYIHPDINHLLNVGLGGYLWEASATSKRFDGENIVSAYNLDYNITDVFIATAPYDRKNVFPLRRLF